MGAQIQKPQTLNLQQYAPPLQQYKLKHCGSNYYVWDNQFKNDSLIEFPINISNSNQLRQQIQMYLFRNRHHLLVSSMYFKRNQHSGKASIFYQRVFTNLSRIKDIPFEDTLQFYYVGFKGFQLLFKKYGYFQIQENMFHITKNKKIKVWCHRDISRLIPSNFNKNQSKGTEQQMVKRIIQIISQNSDPSTNKFNLASILYQQASFNFNAAINRLRQFCQKFGFMIPQKLSCIDAISQGEVGNILDQYGQTQDKNVIPQNQRQLSQPNNLQRFTIKNQQKDPIKQIQPLINQNVQISKIQTTENSTFQTKNRKPRGLQVSHSLQKLKQNNTNSFNQFSTLKIANTNNNGQSQSPIKYLENNRLIGQNGLKYLPIYHPQKVPNQPIRFIPPPSPVQNIQYINPFPIYQPINTQNRPIFLNKTQHLVRKSSFDNFPKDNSLSNSRGNQYKVVINVANRPTTANIAPSSPSFNNHIVSPQQENNLLNPFNPFPQPIFNQVLQNKPTPPSLNPYYNKQIQNRQLSLQLQSNKKSEASKCLRGFQNRQNNRSQFSYNQNSQLNIFKNGINPRQTFITDLSEFQKKQQKKPFTDYTNFKQRFQQFKKNFSYDKIQKKNIGQNNISAPVIEEKNNLSIKTELKKTPFFTSVLHGDTVNSYLQSNGFGEQKKSEIEKKQEIVSKFIKSAINQFPSVTDVSDNVSYLPSKRNQQGTDENVWKQQSIVIKHDPNTSNIQMPTSKKYSANIDKQIWADLQRIKNKNKNVNVNLNPQI